MARKIKTWIGSFDEKIEYLIGGWNQREAAAQLGITHYRFRRLFAETANPCEPAAKNPGTVYRSAYGKDRWRRTKKVSTK